GRCRGEEARTRPHGRQRLPWRPGVVRRGARATLGSDRRCRRGPYRDRAPDHHPAGLTPEDHHLRPMIERPTARALPVLDILPPRPMAGGRGPIVAADARVEEYRPEAA